MRLERNQAQCAPKGAHKSSVTAGNIARYIWILPTLNLVPLQGDPSFWDVLSGFKTPGLSPHAPSGRNKSNGATGKLTVLFFSGISRRIRARARGRTFRCLEMWTFLSCAAYTCGKRPKGGPEQQRCPGNLIQDPPSGIRTKSIFENMCSFRN